MIVMTLANREGWNDPHAVSCDFNFRYYIHTDSSMSTIQRDRSLGISQYILESLQSNDFVA